MTPEPEHRIASGAAEASVVREEYGVDGERRIWKSVAAGDRIGPRHVLLASAGRMRTEDGYRSAWDAAWLRGVTPVPLLRSGPSVAPDRLRVVDVFAGCGGMSLGVKLAAETLGMRFDPAFAADFDPAALRVYEHNLEPAETFGEDLLSVVRYRLSPTRPHRFVSVQLRHPVLSRLEGTVDVLIGGPPCQGHSDLNNHSRRADPKNQLYLVMPALAAALSPKAVIIENVPGVVHDRSRVAETTEHLLKGMGYTVQRAVVSMGNLGIAQLRKRHALVAVRSECLDLEGALTSLAAAPRPTRWAVSGLNARTGSSFDEPSHQSEANQARIRWLFANDAYDLPNRLRPPCHRKKKHTYVSMYGRMDWDSAAQTVTSGFGSPGQGRYIHPREPRTITPHEAARLQFFPDTFEFCASSGYTPTRTELSRMIGNAVPPKMSYALALAVIAALTRS